LGSELEAEVDLTSEHEIKFELQRQLHNNEKSDDFNARMHHSWS